MIQKYKNVAWGSLLFLSSFSALAEDSTQVCLSFGSPAGINFILKSEELGVPLQISVGYWGDTMNGIEVGYNVYQNNDSFFQSIQIISGYSHIEKISQHLKNGNMQAFQLPSKKVAFL